MVEPAQYGPRAPVELTSEWAVAVANEFMKVVQSLDEQGLDPVPIDECWVGEDLALYVRYRGGALRLGARFDDLNVDLGEHDGRAVSVWHQAFYLFHDLYGPPRERWEDSHGYEWHGDEPASSWEYAVEHMPRVTTVRSLV